MEELLLSAVIITQLSKACSTWCQNWDSTLWLSDVSVATLLAKYYLQLKSSMANAPKQVHGFDSTNDLVSLFSFRNSPSCTAAVSKHDLYDHSVTSTTTSFTSYYSTGDHSIRCYLKAEKKDNISFQKIYYTFLIMATQPSIKLWRAPHFRATDANWAGRRDTCFSFGIKN